MKYNRTAAMLPYSMTSHIQERLLHLSHEVRIRIFQMAQKYILHIQTCSATKSSLFKENCGNTKAKKFLQATNGARLRASLSILDCSFFYWVAKMQFFKHLQKFAPL